MNSGPKDAPTGDLRFSLLLVCFASASLIAAGMSLKFSGGQIAAREIQTGTTSTRFCPMKCAYSQPRIVSLNESRRPAFSLVNPHYYTSSRTTSVTNSGLPSFCRLPTPGSDKMRWHNRISTKRLVSALIAIAWN